MLESREVIKNRMLKTAARVWGLQGVEQETSFDPLVDMLINACAAEIEKISRDINISQSRLLERLAQLLTPDAEVGALPAHAVIQAKPLEPRARISQYQQLIWERRSQNIKEAQKDINFSPTSDFGIVKGEIKYLFAKDTLFEVVDSRYKEIYAQALPGKQIPSSSIYIGIQLDKSLNHLDELSVYFDIRNEAIQELFYHYLKRSQWYLGDTKLKSKEGYADDISGENIDLEAILNKNFRIGDKICQHINQFYKKKFITIKDLKNLTSAYKKYPKELAGIFDLKLLEGLEPDLLWLEVRFSEVLSGEILKEVNCMMNCFPAMNRKYNEFTFRLHQNLNIVPLRSEEFFLDLHSVTDTDKKQYHLKSEGSKEGIQETEMILRSNGVGRFDSRDASELIHYLIEAFRDESASFSMIGADTIANSVLELNKAIANLEDKISRVPEKEGLSYLILRSNQPNKNLFVEFWSTNGADGNNIKPGSELNSLRGIDLVNNSAQIVSLSVGGRNRLSQEERVDVYKRSLISKERVVTQQDIKTLCAKHFGKRIAGVEIKKGIAKSISRTSGLTRSIDIYLKPNVAVATTSSEWQYLFEDIKIQLEEGSSNVFPYRFFLKDN